ncbi:capsule biosynthesis protein [Sphingobium phenoxybenzoativorans]|uniref:Capsule biosynthesis protein n=1 Tax=Sphingobium phenoxybenzoativorans TaxID=1592790 RepID=A0A975K5B6_9SPHN|nr:capsule biosynthesis protein [Sphingobium phenoxybenzoativorans]QUT04383.1 capsule biosynthesis protein [Sphingobium phenoxybenzoativorans]
MATETLNFQALGQGIVPILRAPPFPGAANAVVSRLSQDAGSKEYADIDVRACMDALRKARVGGTFWGTHPQLEMPNPFIVRPATTEQAIEMLGRIEHDGHLHRLVLWLPPHLAAWAGQVASRAVVLTECCDPWHLFAQAGQMWFDPSDENLLLARIAGVRASTFSGDGEPINQESLAEFFITAVRHRIADIDYIDPFTGAPSDFLSTIELLKFWRGLIDSNRSIGAAAGFAHWKKAVVEPLLWGGSEPVRFMGGSESATKSIPRGKSIAIWKSRVSKRFLDEVEQQGCDLHEVEDGFIRSAGLGADCVPPLSIVVDKVGVHFDPAQPSDLENLLQAGNFPPAILDRAEALRRQIVESGVSKYSAGGQSMARPAGERRHVLVTGQVEDDRSVICGGGEVAGNLDLLKRARAQEPDAYIIYKPHPDVEAGHRKGHVADEHILSFADDIVRDASISALLDMVDGIHVITSLAGFEALIRGKDVVTHGIPFYAGWGLTTDLGVIPARRTAHRNVIELVAAVLLLYPRYLDPITSLPCPPEVLVKRLAAGVRKENWAIVSLRRLQGSARQKLSKMGITI